MRTSPGPSIIHGGPGVSVSVSVGEAVGDGEAVAVSVGRKVGEVVTVSVGEGSGLVVHVGAEVGVGIGGAMKVSPPHPIENRIIKVIRTKVFFK